MHKGNAVMIRMSSNMDCGLFNWILGVAMRYNTTHRDTDLCTRQNRIWRNQLTGRLLFS